MSNGTENNKLSAGLVYRDVVTNAENSSPVRRSLTNIGSRGVARGSVSLTPLLLAACGGGGGSTPAPTSPTTPTTPDPDFTENPTNTFTAVDDSDSTLDEGSSTAALTVIGKGGDDSITTGSGDDLIRAGEGMDTVSAGGGDDVIVVLGTTTASQYTSSSITNPAGSGVDLSALMTLTELNGRSVSEVMAGETIDGGAGSNTLYIYGTVDLTGVTLTNVTQMIINSNVTLTAEQIAQFTSIDGDGNSVINIQVPAGSGEVILDLSLINVSDIGNLTIGGDVTLRIDNPDDLAGLAEIKAEAGTALKLSVTGDSGATTVNLSQLADVFSDLNAIEIGDNVTLQVDDAADVADLGLTQVEGSGAVEGDGAEEGLQNVEVGGNVEANQAPVISSGATAAVAEDITDTDVIYTATATDADGDTISYSLSDDTNGLFEIDSATGEVTLAAGQTLDYETAISHQITVVASDGELTDSETVTISVTNVNDNAPTDIFVESGELSVFENAAGVDIATLGVTDSDGDLGFLFSVDDGRFEMAGNILRLKDGISIDRNVEETVSVTVTVTDFGNGESYAEEFVVNVIDANEGPVDIQMSDTYMDEDTAGAIIGTVTVDDPDPEGTPNGTHSFLVEEDTLGSGTSTRFEVVDGTLKLKEGVSISYEDEQDIKLWITATDGAGSFKENYFIVNVQDINEAPTGLVLSANHVLETLAGDSLIVIVDDEGNPSQHVNANGTIIGTLTVEDPDLVSSDYYDHVFTVSDDRFDVIVDNSNWVLRLKPDAGIDFETEPSIDIVITVTDDSGDGLSFDLPVTINVGDRIDVQYGGGNADILTGASGEDKIYGLHNDDTLDGAGGDDLLNGGEGDDQISGGEGIDTAEYSGDYADFTIAVDDSGQVTVIDDNASDGDEGTDILTGIEWLNFSGYRIEVSELNVGAPPIITSGTSAVAAEDIGDVDVIYTATATDADSDSLIYSLYEDHDGLFEIDSATGEVTLTSGRSLNYEADTSHLMIVSVTDGEFTDTQEVTVEVTNVNEFDPVFSSSSTVAVAEDIAAETTFHVAVASDGDGDSLTYSLFDDAGGLFQIRGTTGGISLAPGQSLDYETATSHQITVDVSDGTSTVSQALTINVENVVEDVPDVVRTDHRYVAENIDDNVVFYTFVAHDPDGDTITYSLSDDVGGLFEIDSLTGEVSLATGQALDYETETNYEIIMDASDGQSSASIKLVIDVTNVNDNMPVITSGAMASAVEDASANAVIYTATATDGDGDSLTYSLSDDANGLFEIDSATGEVSLAAGQVLDYETADNHQITVVASDGELTGEKTVTVSVSNANDNAPVITSISVVHVPEDVSGAEVLYTTTATDADGDTITYSLTNDGHGFFEIDSSTGVVKLVSGHSLDYETATFHQIVVEASDGELTDDIVVTFVVTDVDDTNHAPVITSGSTASVSEDISSLGIVYSTAVTDDEGDAITFSLSDDAGGLFEIDQETGEVYLTSGFSLDAESDTSHQITIIAADAEGSDSQTVNIEVTDVNDNAPVFTSPDSVEVSERKSGSDVIYQAEAEDPDVSDALTYALTDDADGQFIISSQTGAVHLASGKELDHDSQNNYQITISVTDGHFVAYQEVNLDVTEVYSISLVDVEAGNGELGISLFGVAADDWSGLSVSIEGDINGDGFDDVIVGAYNRDIGGSNAGATYVVYGGTDLQNVNLADIENGDGSAGFVIIGSETDDHSGIRVSGVGDVNGDGHDDLIVGAYFEDTNGSNAGASYLIYGGTDLSHINLADIEAGTSDSGVAIYGAEAGDTIGYSVASGGDINGDGFADLVVGSSSVDTGVSSAGATYIIYGSDTLTNLDLADIETGDGSAGIAIYGVDVRDFSGVRASGIGDVNGDGYDDLVIGAWGVANGIALVGASYVVYGGSDLSNLSLATLEAGNSSEGYVLYGYEYQSRVGIKVSSAGDFNGDGYDDFLIGALYDDTGGSDAGAAYLIYGRASSNNYSLSTIENGNDSRGIMITGSAAGDNASSGVASAGDINGDGYDDIIIGAKWEDTNGSQAGASYIIFGGETRTNVDLTGIEYGDGSIGFAIYGAQYGDHSGIDVSGAGDVNGDGFDDVIIGAYYEDTNGSKAGASYVIYGSDNVSDVTLGTDGNDNLSAVAGDAARDSLIGGLGNDTLTADGGGDVLYGGHGDDTLIIAHDDFYRLEGGGGDDILRLDGTDLDLTAVNNNNLSDLENIDLGMDAGANSLTLDIMDLIDITDSGDRLVVMGDGSDSVTFAESSTLLVTHATGTENIDGQDYDLYTFSNGDGDNVGTLLVDQDVTFAI